MQIMAALVVGVVVAGCGARQQPRMTAGIYAVRITAATIEPRRPDGSPWHVSKPDTTATVVGAAAGLLIGNADVGATIGGAFAEEGGIAEAPSPYVAIKLAGTTWTIDPARRSYSPTWNQAIEINARTLRGDEEVVIQVLDAVDDALLGQTQMRLADLVGQPGHTLTNLKGSVPTLDVEVVLEPNGDLSPESVDTRGNDTKLPVRHP